METRLGGEGHQFFAGGTSNLTGISTRNSEWDLNEWRWENELLVASPLNAVPADCGNKHLHQDAEKRLLSNSSSSSSGCADFELVEKEKNEAEKRRRIIVLEEGESSGGAESLSLKLGGHAYPLVEVDLANWEGNNGKKSKPQGGNSNRPICQVEGCEADLSDSKDYHRRHKVCEMHAKASSAIVRNAIQRFCQQCSRFHLLEEFDEGKRSCRRRLAGHNKRRRKTHLEVNASGNPSVDEQTCGYLLISLLRILSNLQSDNSGQSQNQELLTHFLGNLSNRAKSFDASNLSELLRVSQVPPKFVTAAGTSSQAVNTSVLNGVPERESGSRLCSTVKITSPAVTEGHIGQTNHSPPLLVTSIDIPPNRRVASAGEAVPAVSSASLKFIGTLSFQKRSMMLIKFQTITEPITDRVRKMDFDLNNTYIDPQDCEERDKSTAPLCTGMGSPNCPSWLLQGSHHSSPPQTSGNSDSTSNRSQSSSHGDVQCRTDRIIFKLFGKDPNDLPFGLRAQILDWLSNSPTDIESYIRPGCIILTIYLCQAESAWVELCHDLSSNLNRLLHNSSNDLWTTGWIFTMVRNCAAFIYDGQVVLDLPLHFRHPKHCKILSVTPIAVPHSTTVKFTVKGFNLAQSSTRLLCSFDGKYLVQEPTKSLVEDTGRVAVQELPQCLSFSCLLPDATGRGFIEFEDCGLSNGFFPFIVAEEDVCSEICMLEEYINIASCGDQLEGRSCKHNSRNQALDFMNELGWLLWRSHKITISGESKFSSNIFSITRFRWLMSFAMDMEWPAVVKKLLDILFSGLVIATQESPLKVVLDEHLLHSVVRRKSKALVELLLSYVPSETSKETNSARFLFRPDMLGPVGITPLHIAASTNDVESILDALTSDPEQVGIKAWKNVRDCGGFTPEDYALAQGHDSYIRLVQKKIDLQHNLSQLVLNISGEASYKLVDALKSGKPNAYEMSKSWLSTKQQPYCNKCSRQLVYPNSMARRMLYRPVMLSLVGIAAVCVCVGLLFKTPPQVFYVFPSFRWELLDYGFM
ncbi:squamosa promoter-binding-like protein 6 [Canna indica]|uniref:Squamosa promoter-binding-like protein 6 n=1 Tax=Canna indica TaxID=4628 RepID=A0AAQ3K7J7_9LILI|nr:squamosa promoter-binding-like protein 6 [Canna indica]